MIENVLPYLQLYVKHDQIWSFLLHHIQQKAQTTEHLLGKFPATKSSCYVKSASRSSLSVIGPLPPPATPPQKKGQKKSPPPPPPTEIL